MNRREFLRSGSPSTGLTVLTDLILVIAYDGLVALVLCLDPFAGAAHATTQTQTRGREIKSQIRDYRVTPGAPRVIYDPDGHGTALWVENGQDYPVRVRSWVSDESQKKSAPFAVTPPLLRLDGHRRGRLLILRTGGEFPVDRESLQWVCVRGVPPSGGDDWLKEEKQAGDTEGPVSGMPASSGSCIRLLSRPASLHATPLDVVGGVRWQRDGSQVRARNDSPFYIDFISVEFNGVSVAQPHSVSPYSTQTFSVPDSVPEVSRVRWQIITDNGSQGPFYDAAVN